MMVKTYPIFNRWNKFWYYFKIVSAGKRLADLENGIKHFEKLKFGEMKLWKVKK